jgi:hypothetical protein
MASFELKLNDFGMTAFEVDENNFDTSFIDPRKTDSAVFDAYYAEALAANAAAEAAEEAAAAAAPPPPPPSPPTTPPAHDRHDSGVMIEPPVDYFAFFKFNNENPEYHWDNFPVLGIPEQQPAQAAPPVAVPAAPPAPRPRTPVRGEKKQRGNPHGQRKGYPQVFRLHKNRCDWRVGCQVGQCLLMERFPEVWQQKATTPLKGKKRVQGLPEEKQVELWEERKNPRFKSR